MKIVQLNMVHYGSTGKIMLQIAKVAQEMGHDTWTYSTELFTVLERQRVPEISGHSTWGSFGENMVHYILGTTLGRNGCYSRRGTRKLLRELDAIKPDVLHLHNLHGFCIHLPLLFNYIKKNNIRTVWTLHDCWTFTGQCPYFEMVGCEKWKQGCHHCPQTHRYPKSRMDNTKRMYLLKKKWFTGVENMTLITPSQWLADLVRQSFMKEYPVKVINNGIDLQVFRPSPSDFRQKYAIPEEKKILLGVAFGWGVRKGLDVFIELANRLGDGYQIVLVGTDEQVDAQLPENVISIHRTHNQEELAQLYSAADLLVNPTREDNFPTVNIEALACGTPVLTYRTGGSPEMIDDTCGAAVECDDFEALISEIYRITNERPYCSKACVARAAKFGKNEKFLEYVQLYCEDQ